jgi:hypothetical protein
MRITTALHRRAIVALLCFAAGAVAATAAAPASALGCAPTPKASQPFAAYGDASGYVLTTGGGFEPGTPSWTFSGGARLVSDNAPDPLASAGDSHALYLPAGASVTSACTSSPKIEALVRFWAKAASSDSHLGVEVLVQGGTYSAGTITAGTDWAPTAALDSSAPDDKGAVQYQVRLTAIDGAFTVDDVYIDPWCKL